MNIISPLLVVVVIFEPPEGHPHSKHGYIRACQFLTPSVVKRLPENNDALSRTFKEGTEARRFLFLSCATDRLAPEDRMDPI